MQLCKTWSRFHNLSILFLVDFTLKVIQFLTLLFFPLSHTIQVQYMTMNFLFFLFLFFIISQLELKVMTFSILRKHDIDTIFFQGRGLMVSWLWTASIHYSLIFGDCNLIFAWSCFGPSPFSYVIYSWINIYLYSLIGYVIVHNICYNIIDGCYSVNFSYSLMLIALFLKNHKIIMLANKFLMQNFWLYTVS